MREIQTLIALYFFLHCAMFIEAQGPDPWDSRTKIGNPPSGKNKDPNSSVPTNPLSDIFYKRILQLLVNRGRFKPATSELLGGYLHFEFSTQEFNLLKKYSSLSVPLTPKELREIDGLLADRLIFPSAVQIYAENLIDFLSNFFKNYYIHISFLAAFVSLIYFFRYINWSLVFTIRSFLIIFLFLCIVWEIKLKLEESDVITYRKVKGDSSWWKFWSSNNEIILTDIKSIYETLHPIDICGNVFNRIIFKPMKGLMDFLDSHAEQISGKFYMPFSSIIYTFITVVYFVIVIIACCSFVFYLIFGVAVINLSFLGFAASFKRHDSNSSSFPGESSSSVNQSIERSSHTDHNFKALIDLCSKLADKQSTSKTQAIGINSDFKNIETRDDKFFPTDNDCDSKNKKNIKRTRTKTN